MTKIDRSCDCSCYLPCESSFLQKLSGIPSARATGGDPFPSPLQPNARKSRATRTQCRRLRGYGSSSFVNEMFY
ncbi:hypothetical protein FYJ68_07545 [Olsenella sp. CA-Schmier-601-WT-1]|uniref:Uncharacterized protein n=1 Tax=Olsenella porci TaxID=2652279 RepID=A0A6N7XBJ4_9ACTN|nr:hypothetical protein [Olsenella porci]